MNPRGWNEKSTPSGQEPSYRRPEITFAGHPRRVGRVRDDGRTDPSLEPLFPRPRSGVHRARPRFTCTGFRGTVNAACNDGSETLDRGENLDLAAGRRSCGYGVLYSLL